MNAIFFIYRQKTPEDNLLTVENLREMKKIEDAILNDADFNKYCYLDQSDKTCDKDISKYFGAVNAFTKAAEAKRELEYQAAYQ